MLLFIGGGLWHARHLGDEYLPAFNHVVDRVAAVMSTTHDRLTSPANIQAHGHDGVDDQIFFAPVLDPIIDRLSPSREHTITQKKVWAMNDHLQMWSNRGLNVPWAFREMTVDWPEVVGESGLHVTDRIASHMANVVLNYRCNAKAAQKNGYPYDRTCCSAYRQINWMQGLAAVVSVSVLALAAYGHFSRSSERSSVIVVTDSMALFVLAAVYCFIADRTHIFDKIPKEFANIDFRVMLGGAVLLCLLNIQSIPAVVNKSQKRSPEKVARSAPFLPRQQADEFKGWMQVYVLVYAYTGASNVMDFYKVFRVFIALYLLLSGYGHATYLLRTHDFSIRRVAGVVVRLNTAPVVLALVMDRPYSEYHFAPLVTFWFLVVFLTLSTGRRWNTRLDLLFFKVVIAALLTTMLFHGKDVLETWASVCGVVFRADIDVGDLRFNLGMDNYAVFLGIMIAAAHIKIRSILRTPRKQLSNAGFVAKRYFLLHQVLITAFAAVAIPTYLLLAKQMKNKDAYNYWVPYIAWLPAVSLMILRNATSFLRAKYCASFAWLGRISLELYLLSQHIWLAGDGQGVLRIGFRYGNGTFLGDKWRDLVVLTPIFVWLAWKTHEATRVFTAWLLYGQVTMTGLAQAQHGRPEDGEVMELPGWHRADDDTTDDQESRRGAQQGDRKRLLSRLAGTVVAIWLMNMVNLSNLPTFTASLTNSVSTVRNKQTALRHESVQVTRHALEPSMYNTVADELNHLPDRLVLVVCVDNCGDLHVPTCHAPCPASNTADRN